MESTERRRAERVTISQIVLLGMFREEWIHAKTVDLSRTGFRVRAEEQIDPGSELYVQLDVDGEQVMAWAAVVHTQDLPSGEIEAGCHFTRFQGESRAQLEEYLNGLEA
ncbi:MAG TPA: PilZ domain-containing protein [Alkalispirochaeta sp.]|nr:PilZ domain-containing protein [Alkalispirochaeta sp.]